MSEELKSTQIVYGENVLMMRVDDCLIFGNKNALRSLAEKLTEIPSAESAINYLQSTGWLQEHDRILTESAEPERKNGEWIEDDYGFYRCSECGFEWDEPEMVSRFCPHCGTEMGGGDENAR